MSPSILLRYRVLGGHTHVDVFVGYNTRAHAGKLVLENGEWEAIRRLLPASIEIQEPEPPAPPAPGPCVHCDEHLGTPCSDCGDPVCRECVGKHRGHDGSLSSCGNGWGR